MSQSDNYWLRLNFRRLDHFLLWIFNTFTFTPLQVGFFFRSPYQFLFNKLAVCLCKPSDVFYFFITFKVWASHVPPMNNLRLLAKPIWLMADLWGFVLGHCPSPNEPRSWHKLLRSQFLSQLSQFSLKYFSDLFLFSSFSCFLLPSDHLFAVLSDPSPLVCLIAPLFITSSAGWLKHSPIWFVPCKQCFCAEMSINYVQLKKSLLAPYQQLVCLVEKAPLSFSSIWRNRTFVHVVMH